MMPPLAESTEPAQDRMAVIDHIQERGKSPEHELEGLNCGCQNGCQ
jgi:hypothetical protein